MAKPLPGNADIVTTDDTTIAVTDQGGILPTLVITHGFGGRQQSLRKMLPFLTPRLRVVTYDLRGHGRSGNAPWSIASAVRDLEAVVAWTGDPTAAVAGHSLGGMVAAYYAIEHPECRGAINIDGWGPGQPDQYLGVDPVEGQAFARKAESGQFSGIAKVAVALLNLAVTKEQQASRANVMPSLKGQCFPDIHAKALCPSLAFNASAPSKGVQKWLMGEVGRRVMTGYRKGIARDLAAACAVNPLLQVHDMPEADHSLIGTHPEQTAQAIIDFLATTEKDAG